MAAYTVSEIARLAGVTVRTLHHYDEIGLLVPAERNEAGYRLYGRRELLRLQQILLFREMDVSLDAISVALSDPSSGGLAVLKEHLRVLRVRADRLATLIDTVRKTIRDLEEETKMLTDEQLYRGFRPGEGERYRAEAEERWAEEVGAVEERVRNLTPERWESVGAEGEEISKQLAQLTDRQPDSREVQELVERHHRWIETFYDAGYDRYVGLAEMYVSDERFTAHYDAYGPGLAGFLSDAMKHFAATRLA